MNALSHLAASLGNLAVIGRIQAGVPVYESPCPDRMEEFDMGSLRIPQNTRTFALRVKGDSMVDAGIHPGDVVILEFKNPRNRDIVAALIDGESTLKRYLIQRGKPFLKAENPAYPALIPAQELVIQGVLVAVLRLVA